MNTKICKTCEIVKDVTGFEDREDGWGLYDMCNECRIQLDMVQTTRSQKRYIKKTRMFHLRGERCLQSIL
jgi:hypothetical protein